MRLTVTKPILIKNFREPNGVAEQASCQEGTILLLAAESYWETLVPLLFIARHPAPDIGPGVCYGRSDVPLAAGWVHFADDFSQKLQHCDVRRLYASPLARCRIPAEYVAAQCGIPLDFDERLMELNFGTWEGLSWNDVPREQIDQWAMDLLGFSPPRGENGRALCERVKAFYADLPPYESCAVLSHGGPLRVLQSIGEGKEPDLTRPAPPLGKILRFTDKMQPAITKPPVPIR
ncbi:histidine phosphatase family protein [Kozakia baliensis]|uniref:histidine phosphatase family protein n=1 Tax=Kozakia baliensis TaxID=153496 RepID=UPI000495ABCA